MDAQKAQMKKEMEAIGEEILEKAGTWTSMVYQVYRVTPFGQCAQPGSGGCRGLMKDYDYYEEIMQQKYRYTNAFQPFFRIYL